MILKEKGGVMNIVAANTTARALIERSDEEHVKCMSLNILLGQRVYSEGLS